MLASLHSNQQSMLWGPLPRGKSVCVNGLGAGQLLSPVSAPYLFFSPPLHRPLPSPPKTINDSRSVSSLGLQSQAQLSHVARCRCPKVWQKCLKTSNPNRASPDSSLCEASQGSGAAWPLLGTQSRLGFGIELETEAESHPITRKGKPKEQWRVKLLIRKKTFTFLHGNSAFCFYVVQVHCKD